MHKKIYCYIPQNSLLQREDFSVIHRQASPIKLSEPGAVLKMIQFTTIFSQATFPAAGIGGRISAVW